LGDVFEIFCGKTGETVELVCLTWKFGTPFFCTFEVFETGGLGKNKKFKLLQIFNDTSNYIDLL